MSNPFQTYVESDSELSDLMLEVSILVDFMRKRDVAGAQARIDGWSAEQAQAACLFLAQAVSEALPAGPSE